VQFDEKWSFVGKKEKHCDPTDPADAKQGDNWDHVALDAEHRLVVSVVPGKRTVEHVEALVQDFQRRTEGRPMNLVTSDEYKPYRQAILKAYGEKVTAERTGKRGRPAGPRWKPSPALTYATVHKTREKGRVVKIDFRVVFGTVAAVSAALKLSQVSSKINTAFVAAAERNRPRPQRPKDVPASRRIGASITRSPTSPCTATIFAGRCERSASAAPTAAGYWPRKV
jgi:hypothetical protein